jgi:outer membrane protein TolC
MATSAAAADQPSSTPAPDVLTIRQAVDLAVAQHPAAQQDQARADAARANVGVAKLAYAPKVDLLWQENRGTRANVFGPLLPQAVIPPISGPVLDASSLGSVWDSAAGALLSWEFVDFGQRKASVGVARAETTLAEARRDLTRLDLGVSAADLFLTALAADQRVAAAQANVNRLRVFTQSVHALTDAELRPGADASRADAELASAQSQLIQAEQAASLARLALAQAVGLAGQTPRLEPGRLLEHVPPPVPLDAHIDQHPALVAQMAAVDIVRSREHALDRSYAPRINFQASVSARGTGAAVEGVPDHGDGLWPQVSNWATGITVTLPALDFFTVRARRQVERSTERAEQAKYDQVTQELETNDARARVVVDGARRIAENTVTLLTAAQQGDSGARPVPGRARHAR